MTAREREKENEGGEGIRRRNDRTEPRNGEGMGRAEEESEEGAAKVKKKKGMHVGIVVSLCEQLSQTQLHRFFSVVDFRSRFFRRVIAEHSTRVVHYMHVCLYGVSGKSLVIVRMS